MKDLVLQKTFNGRSCALKVYSVNTYRYNETVFSKRDNKYFLMIDR